jgi:hypothetical protein
MQINNLYLDHFMWKANQNNIRKEERVDSEKLLLLLDRDVNLKTTENNVK